MYILKEDIIMKKSNKVMYILGYVCLLGACFSWGWNYNDVMKDDN